MNIAVKLKASLSLSGKKHSGISPELFLSLFLFSNAIINACSLKEIWKVAAIKH